uniref:CCHC-type domain-containing protein n=1 Tax=Tanacetum cinerariifolium TaxID=118510 RepID=A0A6L2J8X6_TANCI|nr:hypothetical protein [Tanacetum cinerariifolium]
MDQQNPTLAKIPILDTGKFKQWQFRIQQYIQHEHYALWEVIKFGYSYEVPKDNVTTGSASDGTGKKKGRTVALTTDDMQKRKNDVKARTNLLLALPDEHQLCFSKHKTAQELWDAILKTFGCNEATKKTKKNLLKQQYGNFKAEGSETLDQTFNRLQVIVSHLEFLDIEIEHDDLNQKFLTSLAPEWLMHTIVWRTRSNLDTMSLDDLYNHLKVYDGNEEVNTANVSTASTNVSTASSNIRAASISQDTACAYIAFQSNGSQIKFEDINQIDEDDMEEMDIKWNMALLSMRADRFWKKTRMKIIIQGTDVAGFDKSKVECFNCHKMGHFARECMAPKSQDRGRKDNYRQGSKIEEQAPKALMAIDGNMIYHYKLGLSQVEGRLAEFKNQEVKYYEKIRILEFKVESRANIESLTKELELIKKEKEGLDSKLAGFQIASKDLDNLIESQRSDKNKEGLGYSVVPPPLLLKPSPAVESITDDLQNRNPSVTETGASPKPFIKFVKAADRHTENKTDKGKTVKKHAVKYAELYRKPSKSSSIRGSQRNWNNLKSQQLENFPLVARNLPLLIWERRETLLRPQRVGFGSLVRTQLTNVQIATVSGSSQNNIDDKGYWDSGCSRHMTGNISYLSDYEPFDRGDFKLIDDTYVLLRTPRQHNMYSIDLNNIVPHKDLTCLVAKASADEWIKREFSNARTPQQNGVAERRNITLIEAARTMLADAKLLVTFWAEAVNTACYVQNRVLVNKSQNKTPYELFNVETPIPTVSSPVPTACLNDSQEPSSDTRLISKRVANQVETPSLDNILTLTNRFEDILGVTTNLDESNGVEADVSNMETTRHSNKHI